MNKEQEKSALREKYYDEVESSIKRKYGHRRLREEQKCRLNAISRGIGEAEWEIRTNTKAASRETAIALSRLEEALLWARRSIEMEPNGVKP